jgi:hypothetical protein
VILSPYHTIITQVNHIFNTNEHRGKWV